LVPKIGAAEPALMTYSVEPLCSRVDRLRLLRRAGPGPAPVTSGYARVRWAQSLQVPDGYRELLNDNVRYG
jgi:hypothetical protein